MIAVDPIPTATYRIQLRNGVDFAACQQQLDYLSRLGITHLYLSPIFTASRGSTHGYDVLDPTEIDAVLGGRAGFEQLAEAAHARGIGIILDIVPNHTAFTLENLWLCDVLRHGKTSRYAHCFDIDWAAGPLVLPFLPEPFEKMLADERLAVADGYLIFDDVRVPLAKGTDNGDIRSIHKAQHWRLRHWEIERDGITHRRFFNVTSLIGMRVEDHAVFDDTHSLIVDLAAKGLVDGLRVDHIDGLADPETYLEWLAEATGGIPVWVEKILTGNETLPENWKCVGTTGYEAAVLIAQLLTRKSGIDRLRALWLDWTGSDEPFPDALRVAKKDVLRHELAAELHQLVGLAQLACLDSPIAEPGPESLREAIAELLIAMPQYRSYFRAGHGHETDRQVISDAIEAARRQLRSSTSLDAVASLFLSPSAVSAHDFVRRFQQVSGALLAKAQEDTAGFRWPFYLAANEVGAEPSMPTIPLTEANDFLTRRAATEMTSTSTHDTKRSEDARMRMVAISHHPDAFASLLHRAARLETARGVSPQWQWYCLQSALALWDAEGDIAGRLADHLKKAMREAKQDSFWTHPDETMESAGADFIRTLCESWRQTRPAELDDLLSIGDDLSLVQLTLKCLLPGFPDFYRGSEGIFLALTDPDNRLPVDFSALARLPHELSLSGEKARLTAALLALRKSEAAFFARAATSLLAEGETFCLSRIFEGRELRFCWGDGADFRTSRVIYAKRLQTMNLVLGWV